MGGKAGAWETKRKVSREELEREFLGLRCGLGVQGQVGGSLLGVCARGKREITPGETRAGLGLGLNSYTYFLLGQLGELEEKRQLLRPEPPVPDREAKEREMTCLPRALSMKCTDAVLGI